MVDPLQPSGALRAAVDQDESVDHGRPPVSQTNQHIGPETNTEPDAVTNPVIMDHILDLENAKHIKLRPLWGFRLRLLKKLTGYLGAGSWGYRLPKSILLENYDPYQSKET